MVDGSQIEDLFVCVGAQKAGTTWLARMLARHPDLFITPVKEIHYFDNIQGQTQHLSDRKRRSRKRKYYQRMLTQWHRFAEYRGQAAWYRDSVVAALRSQWERPILEGSRGTLEVTVAFEILPDGTVRNLRIDTTSGVPSLDRSALRAVADASPLPPLPGT